MNVNFQASQGYRNSEKGVTHVAWKGQGMVKDERGLAWSLGIDADAWSGGDQNRERPEGGVSWNMSIGQRSAIPGERKKVCWRHRWLGHG